MKISLITVSYNAENTISRCIESVIAQDYNNVEYIIIDGKSTDNTINIVKKYQNHISAFLSEPDKGIYDAINKGIKIATGDIIGLLNTDDYFANDKVLSDIAILFNEAGTRIIYGDLDYVDQHDKVLRRWRSGNYQKGLFNWGWMPPHPTFYCRRNLFEKYGLYSLDYGTAADYELMLRFIHFYKVPPRYLEKVIIKMKIGGASNKSLNNRVKGLIFDFKAMRRGRILLPVMTIIFKPLRKILQYL